MTNEKRLGLNVVKSENSKKTSTSIEVLNQIALSNYLSSISCDNILTVRDFNMLYSTFKNGDNTKLSEVMMALKYFTYYMIVNTVIPEDSKVNAYTLLDYTYQYLVGEVTSRELNENADYMEDYFSADYHEMIEKLIKEGNKGHKRAYALNENAKKHLVVGSKTTYTSNQGIALKRQALTNK